MAHLSFEHPEVGHESENFGIGAPHDTRGSYLDNFLEGPAGYALPWFVQEPLRSTTRRDELYVLPELTVGRNQPQRTQAPVYFDPGADHALDYGVDRLFYRPPNEKTDPVEPGKPVGRTTPQSEKPPVAPEEEPEAGQSGVSWLERGRFHGRQLP